MLDITNERCHDSTRDCILSAGKVLFREVTVLGPEVAPVRHLNEIDDQAKSIAASPEGAIHHKPCIELLLGKPLIEVTVVVRECGMWRKDRKLAKAGQCTDKVHRERFTEIAKGGIVSRSCKGKHQKSRTDLLSGFPGGIQDFVST